MNRSLTLAVVAATAVAGVAFTWSWAQSAPNPGARTIPYQGHLEINGAAASPTTPPSMTFTLTDGSSTWTECYAAVPVSAGRFSIELGSYPGDCASCAATSCSDGDGVPAWAFQTGDLRLSITVNGTALGNVQRIQAVPYSVTAVHSATADRVLDQGRVGEIRYSLLTEPQFQARYGASWRLLDGDSIAGTDKLATLFGSDTLPDARGRFLRMKDHAKGDNADGDLALGAAQEDAFQGHFHQAYRSAGVPGLAGGGHEAPALSPDVAVGPSLIRQPIDGGYGAPRLATETRPKNVTINVFVKTAE